MEELLAEQDSDIKSFKHGDVVEGTVVRIDKDEILVDIGAKSEGVVSNRELYGRHAESPARSSRSATRSSSTSSSPSRPRATSSCRSAAPASSASGARCRSSSRRASIIEAPVIDHNKGGLIVDCGIRGFVPISQIVDFPRRPQNDQPRDAAQEIAEKLQPFVGRKLRLKILEVNRKANRLILSEKVALYEERREKRDELFSSLQVGQKVTGTVRSIAPFGVFIDLGGIDGLVHKSELSWNKVNNPESGYKVGDEVEAEVIDINHERGRISLSIRRLQPDPWHSTVADFKVGDVIDGTVTKLVNFGAFVRVRDGLEGLIHISELSHQRVAHPGDVVHEGQTLKLKIISLDSERHRLGLSLKQAEEPPARPVAEAGAPSAPPRRAPGAPRAERRPRPSAATRCPTPSRSPRAGSTTRSPPPSRRSASSSRPPRSTRSSRRWPRTRPSRRPSRPTGSTASSRRSPRTRRSRRPSRPTRSKASSRRSPRTSRSKRKRLPETIETIVGDVAEDEAIEDAFAAQKIDAIVDAVAADEASLEAAAAAEVDRLADAAAANDDNAACCRCGRGRRRRDGRRSSRTPKRKPPPSRSRRSLEDRRRGPRADEEAIAAESIETVVGQRRRGRGRSRRPSRPTRSRRIARDRRRGRGSRGGHRGRDHRDGRRDRGRRRGRRGGRRRRGDRDDRRTHDGGEHGGLTGPTAPPRRPAGSPAGRFDSLTRS